MHFQKLDVILIALAGALTLSSLNTKAMGLAWVLITLTGLWAVLQHARQKEQSPPPHGCLSGSVQLGWHCCSKPFLLFTGPIPGPNGMAKCDWRWALWLFGDWPMGVGQAGPALHGLPML